MRLPCRVQKNTALCYHFPMLRKIFFLCAATFALSSAYCDAGDRKYVSVPGVSMRASRSNFSGKIAPLSYGEQVTVMREERKWTFVSSGGGKSGWVPSSVLSKKKIVSGVFVDVDAKELALAGKGFSGSDEGEYKMSGRANYDAVDNMEKNVVTDSELREFLSDGGLTVE